jgi:uncharacterized protein (TIGR03382 family)
MMLYRQVLGMAVLSACGVLVTAMTAQAAPPEYQSAVLANNPYLYHRLQETDPLKDQPANDFSVNNRDGIYRGNPTGGVAGQGTGSDTAVSFPAASLAGLDYLRTTDAMPFGHQVHQSSYEFVFKSNTANLQGYQTLFGIFNAAVPAETPVDDPNTPIRTASGAVAVELNSNATGNLNNGTSRFYIRDEDGQALGGTIANGSLLDGNFHHLLFTYDVNAGANNYIKAYVDGVPVAVNHVGQGTGGAPTSTTADFFDFTRDPTFAARNLRGVVDNEANVTLDEVALYANTVLSAEQAATNASAAGIVVPEPGSLTLAGMAGLALLRRRRHA